MRNFRLLFWFLLCYLGHAELMLLVKKFQNSPGCTNTPVNVQRILPNICLSQTMETYSCPAALKDGATIIYTTFKDPGCEQWIRELNYSQNACFLGTGGFTFKWTCTNAAAATAPSSFLFIAAAALTLVLRFVHVF